MKTEKTQSLFEQLNILAEEVFGEFGFDTLNSDQQWHILKIVEASKNMVKKEVQFRDPIVERVVDKFISRSEEGFKKYGVTLDEEFRTGIKGIYDYVNDIQEELMDAVLYMQAAKESLQQLLDIKVNYEEVQKG